MAFISGMRRSGLHFVARMLYPEGAIYSNAGRVFSRICKADDGQLGERVIIFEEVDPDDFLEDRVFGTRSETIGVLRSIYNVGASKQFAPSKIRTARVRLGWHDLWKRWARNWKMCIVYDWLWDPEYREFMGLGDLPTEQCSPTSSFNSEDYLDRWKCGYPPECDECAMLHANIFGWYVRNGKRINVKEPKWKSLRGMDGVRSLITARS
jgi:hypothetical protein